MNMSLRHKFLGSLLTALAFAVVAAPACAQQDSGYPSHTIKIVVPYSAGGVTDIIARALGEQFHQRLGQPVIVENRPGAAGSIGTEYVAHAKADGYTLLVASPSHTSNVSLYKHLKWDPIKSFAPIGKIGIVPSVIVVNPALPVHSLAEMIQYATANPGKLTCASAGVGSSIHLAELLLESMAHIKMLAIPYKGQPDAVSDLLENRVSMMPLTMALALPYVKSGKLRALTVTSAQRSQALPDVPTVAESGFPGFEVVAWFGLLAPVGTPDAVIKKMNEQIHLALKQPDVKQRLTKFGFVAQPSTTGQFGEFLRTDVAKWAKILGDARVKKQ
jgi:tripartite-type tricarboxylate transporter receptor subunit TctC